MRFCRLLSIVAVLAIGACLLACVPVFAADLVTAPASAAPAALADFLTNAVFPVLSALLMGVVTPLIYRLGAKYKIEALTQKDNFLERVAFQGITLAEERAAQLVGSKSALTGNDKLDIAVAHVLGVMPKVTETQAEAMVHGLLAQIPGLGATGDKAVSNPGSVLSTIGAPMLSAEFSAAPMPAAAAPVAAAAADGSDGSDGSDVPPPAEAEPVSAAPAGDLAATVTAACLAALQQHVAITTAAQAAAPPPAHE